MPGEPEADVPVVTPRRGLAAWPIRRKLIALVTGPLVVIVIAGVFFTAQSVTNLRAAQRARDLANAALLTNQLDSAINNEMAATLRWRDQPSSAPLKAEVTKDRVTTNAAWDNLRKALSNPPGGKWSSTLASDRSEVIGQMDLMSFVRDGADRTNGRLLIQSQYVAKVQSVLNLLSDLTLDLAISAPDARTVDAASAMGALGHASNMAAEESVTLTSSLLEGRIAPKTQSRLTELKVAEDFYLKQAKAHSTTDQGERISQIRTDDNQIDRYRQTARNMFEASNGQIPTASRDSATKQASSFANASWQRVRNLDGFLNGLATDTRDHAADVARNGLVRSGVVSVIAVLGLLLGSALVAKVTRTVTVPMRRLRAGAVDAAAVRLPALVRQIEQEGSDAQLDIPPVLPPGTHAGPETLEVAQAVDGLTAEAVRLATVQVRLRHALDEAFVSMSRRSQSMVEKQLAIIDELESTEEDPEQLRNLFRLDHLAARMRRYNDNLLVLAGSTLRTRSAAPVPVADVFRAATSEMEQYERVRLQPVNGVAVSGPVAGGLVHLLAELLDNAAMYSPPTSPILLSGTLAPDGGLHLEITDSGVGIPPSELADLNSRLGSPGSIDTQVPSRMGLYVVARLAQRGGFGVRLSPRANAAGTVAEVDVPPSMVVGTGRPGLPGQGPGGSSRPDGPRLPGQPTPGQSFPGQPFPGQSSPGDGGRAPAPVGGMRSDPALRLSGRPGAVPTSPRGIPGLPGSAPGEAPDATSDSPSPATPMAPAASARGGDGPPIAVRPLGGAPGGAPGGLPSRRPGAALAGNPLAARSGGDPASRSGFDPFGGSPASSNPAPSSPAPGSLGGGSTAGGAAAAVGGVAAARAGTPPAGQGEESGTFGDVLESFAPRAAAAPTAPAPQSAPASPAAAPSQPAPTTSDQGRGARFEAPLTGDLPRRTRGTALAGTPLATGPRPVHTPLNGVEASRMFGGPEDLQVEPPADERGAAPGSGLPGDPAGPSDGSGESSARPPVRPFAQPRPVGGAAGRPATGARPPFRPGASSAQAGASAATAAAAAARARAAAGGRPPTPGTGLFAATGPATLPGGVRPSVTVPLGPSAPSAPGAPGAHGGDRPAVRRDPAQDRDQDRDRDRAFRRPPAAPARQAPDGAPASSGPDPLRSAPEPARPSIPMASIPPVAQTPPREPEPRFTPSVPLQAGDLDGPLAAFDGDDATTPIFDSISAWFETESPPARSEAPQVIDLRDTATVGAAAAMSGAGSGAGPGTGGRWAALGDQRWLATNARAAAAPEIAGNTEAGLPRRQPGANLLPSAVEAAPGRTTTARPDVSEARAVSDAPDSAPAVALRPDADAVRGRLGSYQRGLTTARRARHLPGPGTTRQALGESESRPQDGGHRPADQGGDQ